jgi:23S rRNA pseudouridine2605 synthase
MNSNEKWQGKPAGRDGKPSEKRDVKSILKGTRGAAKSTTENENRNYNRTDYNHDQPANTGNSFTGEKRKFELKNGNSYNSDRRPYENRESRPQYGERKPYQNRDGRPQFGERKPYENREGRPQYGERKPYENREGRPQFGERKPYENREGRPQYGERKPYQNRSEEGNRPRFKPRTNTDGNSEHKLTIKKPGEGQLTEFVEYRFDNQNDTGARKTMRKRSGNYDPNAKYSTKKQLEYRKQVVDLTKPVRLNKFLANAGICSRREADEFIQAGVISVNGEIVTELGTKVMHADKILFHNQPVRSERKVYLLLNKPKDCVTTAEDTHARTTVLDLVKNACSERIYPVGRLDRNTTGVILLTNDGDLASKLTHPKYDKKKIYHVALDKPLVAEHYEAILGGVVLEDGKIAADSLEFVKDGDFKQVGIEIHSGQNRVVRRIFEKLGYRVVRLDRVYFAGLTKKSLPRGKYRFLNEREVNMLKMGAYE